MKRIISGLGISIMTVLFSIPSLSLPRYALMNGARCGSCHVNPTGGLMRNEYGIRYSIDKIPLESLKDSDFTLTSKLNDNISIGGDYRSQFIYDGGSKTTAFQAMTTTIYGSIILNKKFTFFFKQDLVNSGYGPLNGPEVYAIARLTPGFYIKGGDFLPDYGWRLDDHTSYIRGGDLGYISSLGVTQRGLIFIPNYKDVGMEIGGNVGGLVMSAGLFNGTGNTTPIDFSKYKAYSAKVEYMGTASDINFRIGASGYGFNTFTMGGFTLGLGTGNIVLLGEIDWTKNYAVNLLNPGGYSMAAYGELDYLAVQGLWLTGKYDMFDPIQGTSNDEIGRITLGMEFFPLSFVEIRPQYRINTETPSVGNDQALAQVHLWF